jgi:N-acetylmuramic acid 6-phosphate (MurNAc-6-P) etherase
MILPILANGDPIRFRPKAPEKVLAAVNRLIQKIIDQCKQNGGRLSYSGNSRRT